MDFYIVLGLPITCSPLMLEGKKQRLMPIERRPPTNVLVSGKAISQLCRVHFLADRLHSGRKVTMLEPWERLSTEEKIDFLRREVEGLKQILSALARRVDQGGGTVKTSIPDRAQDA
jgi:hypothetical protein